MKALLIITLSLICYFSHAQNEKNIVDKKPNFIIDGFNNQFVWANGVNNELYIGISNDQGVYRLIGNTIFFHNPINSEGIAVCKITADNINSYFIKPSTEFETNRMSFNHEQASDTLAFLNNTLQMICTDKQNCYIIQSEENNDYTFYDSNDRLLKSSGINKTLVAFFFINDYLPKEELRKAIKENYLNKSK